MLHFNRKIYLIPNRPFYLWFGSHVVSSRFIKANISLIMKGCFKLRRHNYICSSSCLKILFHLNICLIQIKNTTASLLIWGKWNSLSVLQMFPVIEQEEWKYYFCWILSQISFEGSCSYSQLPCCWSLWFQFSELKQKLQPCFPFFTSQM